MATQWQRSRSPCSTARRTPDTFRAEVLAGLQSFEKTLPCKYFYDQRGSQLFDQICDLPEYYPTRTEAAHHARPCGRNGRAVRPGLPAD